ncbi:MAG: polysaccharide deacetylase family protein [Bacteroidia bacterium]|nr:polysaccharide deacetylase family protein [Bacteroidia bacterium]
MHIVLIYTKHITNRLTYIANVLLPESHFQIKFTTSENEFNTSTGTKINYSNTQFDNAIQIVPHGLLAQKHIENIAVDVLSKNGLIQLFNNKSELGFDVLAASFYLISRYEEYLPYQPDAHGRFTSQQSIAGKHGFLSQALVNRYMLLLHQKLHEICKLPLPPIRYNALITMDIDSAYAFLGKGYWRTIGAYAKLLLTCNFAKVAQRTQTLLGKADPFNTYSFFASCLRPYNLKPMFFILMGDYGRYDKNISYQGKYMQKLIAQLKTYGTIGLHPSYYAVAKNKIGTECKRIQKITHEDVQHSRFHFLRLKLPQAYRQLLDAGITNDYSMGYADCAGFRASTSLTHYFFDIENDVTTPLQIHPLTVMDASLHSYMKMQPDEACDEISKLINEVKKYGGTFNSLWHNDTISNLGIWQNWQAVFMHTLKQAAN